MRAGEGKRPCQEAEAYYYDFLCQDEAAVPEPVRRHITACPVCQERIRRLRDTLFEAQRNSRPADTWDGKTIEELAVQFQLLDERVTCSDVKCFLPKLAMAAPQIRIPTPVTVHVDQCPQCAQTLAAIRELVVAAAREHHFPATELAKIVMAVDEACVNVVEHAYGGEADRERARLEIRLHVAPGRLDVTILDRSPTAFSPLDHALPDLAAYLESGGPKGLGILILRRFMDKVSHSYSPGSGNRLHLVKYLSSERPPSGA